MKALHVNDYRAGGGCEILMERTVALLRAAGLDVEVFTSDDVPGLRRHPVGYVDSRRARRALAAKLEASRPDVVHLHNFYHVLSPGILGGLAAYRRKHELRVVMTAHDYHLVCPNSGLYYVRKGRPHPAEARRLESVGYLVGRRWDHRGLGFSLLKLVQHLYNYRMLHRERVIDCVICPSRFLERILRGRGLTTRFVAHPVPVVGPPAPKPADEIRLVFAGRVEPEKGLGELLASFPSSFPGRFTVIGDGSDLARCRRICRERGLEGNVELTGRLPHPDTMARLAESHVLVLPSRCAEGSPLSLLEALALGTNILVSDVGGMREIVETAGVGFAFSPEDPASLGTALDSIVEGFRRGTLNDFHVSSFLRAHDESTYTERLLEAYRTEPSPAEPAGRPAARSACES